MKYPHTFVLSLLFVLLCFSVTAQETSETIEDLFKVNYDTPRTLDLEAEQEDTGVEPVKQKKKKVKKNVFYGIKTRKGFTKSVIRGEVVYETFHIMRVYEAPPEYARDFYWFDYKKKKITNSLRVKQENAGVLHGPYKKMVGDVVLEEGWYYKGMKHRRWLRWNKYDILQDKKYWWKGWPEQSLLSYYDFKKTKLKEVIPVHHEEREGEYWAFHKDGSIAVRGQYKFDHRVGTWKEYYDQRRIKREVKYADEPFDFGFKPHILREWDRRGKVLYDRSKEKSTSG